MTTPRDIAERIIGHLCPEGECVSCDQSREAVRELESRAVATDVLRATAALYAETSAVLRNALAFYADQGSWTARPADVRPAISDKGTLARRTLHAIDTGTLL